MRGGSVGVIVAGVLYEENEPSSGGRRRLLIAVAAVVFVVAALAAWFLAQPGPPSEDARVTAPAPAPAAPPRAGERPGESASGAAPEDAAAELSRARRKPPSPPKPAPAPAAPTLGELRIDSDVPGAMVFIDRKYVGETPVTARDIQPGTHQLNLSADGYDGQSQTIEVAAGTADVMVRFREIRLNESVDVVHKHGVGSCEGRLMADPKGLRYETANKNDSFSLGFEEVEVFEVDYLKKNLRVKKRGGKTWNFTTRHENADPIFVFHRNVEKVRARLKAGS